MYEILTSLYGSIGELPSSAIVTIILSHLFLTVSGFSLGYRYRHNLELSQEAKLLREKEKSQDLIDSLQTINSELKQTINSLEQTKSSFEQKNGELLERNGNLEFLLKEQGSIRPLRTRPW